MMFEAGLVESIVTDSSPPKYRLTKLIVISLSVSGEFACEIWCSVSG